MPQARLASINDLVAVTGIYEKIHNAEEAGLIRTGWIRDIYPVRRTAESAQQFGELFVLEDAGRVCGAAIINQKQVDVYAQGQWRYAANPEHVMVLHTLAIDPDYMGRGYGKSFVRFYAQFAREHGCPFLRMDTNVINQTARKFYSKMGFTEAGIVGTTFNGISGVNLVLLERESLGL